MKWEPKKCVHGVSMADTCYQCALNYKIQQAELLAIGYRPDDALTHERGNGDGAGKDRR